MASIRSYAIVVGAASVLSACSFSSDSLWPSLTGDSAKPAAAPAGQQVAIQPSAGERSGQPLVSATSPPRLGTTNFDPPPVTPGQSTGTFVGQKVSMLRAELTRMQNQVRQENQQLQQIRAETAKHSQVYHATIGAINARLQIGTTPGNPFLVQQWNQAQNALSQIDGDVARLNGIANSVAGTSTLSAYLLETTRAAYGVSGAVEEDHRQLAILEDEVNRTVVLIDRLLNEISEDVNRQTLYVANERSNLTSTALAIKNGEMLGGSLSNRAFSSSAPIASAAPISNAAPASTVRPSAAAGRRPLVVIRFDRPNVAYEQALYTAVSRALQRRPQAMFDLVAVSTRKGAPAQSTVAANQAKRNAESVLRSLSEMGLPLDRVRLSAMSSADAQSNEVHLYVR